MFPPRLLRQPGPARACRLEIVQGDAVRLDFPLRQDATLHDALVTPLIQAGFQSATVRFSAAALNPFRYVRPAPAADDRHVAYFSAPHAPQGTSRIEVAQATFGFNQGAPAVHCHAVWVEPDGSRRGGHILPVETVLAEPAQATAHGFRDIRIETRPDPETNFPLFTPAGGTPGGRAVVARVAPNLDILTAVETVAARLGIRDAAILGTLGSLIGACFTTGAQVADHATEVLVREGFIRDGTAALDLLAVDMQGRVHEGWLAHGQNPVCITFDLVLEDLERDDRRQNCPRSESRDQT